MRNEFFDCNFGYNCIFIGNESLKFLIALIVSVSVIAGVAAYEFQTRTYLYKHYMANATPMLIRNSELGKTPTNELLGRNQDLSQHGPMIINQTLNTQYLDRSSVQINVSAKTNNYGFLSSRDYVIERDKDNPEYRIVIVGDSMTGNILAGIEQWPDLVEDLLNSSLDIAKHLNAKKVKVYNLGVPGAGFAAFWRLYNDYGRQFDPDLIIVNYIESDFPRTDSSVRPHTEDENEMIYHAETNVKKFIEEGRKVIFTQMPLYSDLFPTENVLNLSKKLQINVPEMKLYYLKEFLPWKENSVLAYNWYHLPLDGHPNPFGCTYFAKAISDIVLLEETKLQIDLPVHEIDSVFDDSEAYIRSEIVNSEEWNTNNSSANYQFLGEYSSNEPLKYAIKLRSNIPETYVVSISGLNNNKTQNILTERVYATRKWQEFVLDTNQKYLHKPMITIFANNSRNKLNIEIGDSLFTQKKDKIIKNCIPVKDKCVSADVFFDLRKEIDKRYVMRRVLHPTLYTWHKLKGRDILLTNIEPGKRLYNRFQELNLDTADKDKVYLGMLCTNEHSVSLDDTSCYQHYQILVP